MDSPDQRTVSLEEALRNGWVEYWYQPKIDLRRKQLVGFETFARIRHARHGILSVSAFLKTAEAESVTTLSERALVSALKTSQNLREMGILNVRLAVNMRLAALVRFPIAAIVQKYRDSYGSPSLIFDVAEGDVISNMARVQAVSSELKRHGFNLAIDDFGRSLMSRIEDRRPMDRELVRFFKAMKPLKGGQFAEMKLDRSIVSGCSTDPRKRLICANIIGLAHTLGSQVVAIGVENNSDLEVLKKLGCDIGQGFLFGQPMSEEEFIMSLWQRAVRRDGKAGPQEIFQRASA